MKRRSVWCCFVFLCLVAVGEMLNSLLHLCRRTNKMGPLHIGSQATGNFHQKRAATSDGGRAATLPSFRSAVLEQGLEGRHISIRLCEPSVRRARERPEQEEASRSRQ